MSNGQFFANLSSASAKAAGRPSIFILAAAMVAAWGITGPVLGYSDSWQLMMNTVSSIVTFLMVFLIQNTQTRDSEAMHAKLDALIAAIEAADNRYIRVERFTDDTIEEMRIRFGPHPPSAPSE